MKYKIFVFCALFAVNSLAESPLRLQGERVAVESQVIDGAIQERYLARKGDTWVEVATTVPGLTAGPVNVVINDSVTTGSAATPLVSGSHAAKGGGHKLSLTSGTLVAKSDCEGHRLIRRISIEGDWVRVVTRLEPSKPITLRTFTDQYRASQLPDWCYSPSVGGFNPDAKYKSPLIISQSGRNAFGIIPDVTSLDKRILGLCPHALDLDVPAGPLLTVGYIPTKMLSHSVWGADGTQRWEISSPIENTYLLQLNADAEPGQAFRQAVRLHWQRYGRAEQSHAAEQQKGRNWAGYANLELWDSWRPFAWTTETQALWREVPLPGGGTGGAAKTVRTDDAVYLSAWFNSMRTAVAMGLYAKRVNDSEAMRRASQTLDLALHTPGKEGAFKCIAIAKPDGSPVVWWAGDGSGQCTKTGYLGYDMSWTAYWLLKWRAAGLPGGEEILPRCRALASFLIARQSEDGMLPNRFNEDGSVDEKVSRMLRAETGPIALFLLELNAQDPDPKLLTAALKGLAFLDREVVATRQWYDFESFFSCNARPEAFDERTKQWPANNLALSQSVSAYLMAWRATKDRHWLEQGEAVLDYLLLYQQCWTDPSPRITDVTSPTMFLGGFTTQNADGEWSDARQSQIGNALLDWYRETGKAEYLERGIAALRAQFPVSPDENHAHNGYNGHTCYSGFHWGTGSGMAGIELEEDFLRDAIVDLRAGVGIGVNGLNLTGLTATGEAIAFSLNSPFKWTRPAVVIFRNAETERRYTVTVNGKVAGTWTGRELMAGVGVNPQSLQAATLTYKDLVKRLTDMEQIAVLPPAGEKGALASSYDRASRYDGCADKYIGWDANGDGGGVIRKEGEGSVLAEIQGPGCIWRTWSATVNGGHVKIYLDGAETPAVDLPWEGYFDGKNQPFTQANLVYKTKAQGYNNYTPIPFQKSCKIVASSKWGNYYQFNYTTFPAGTVVPTFKLPLAADDLAALDEANRIMGQCGQDPAGKWPGQKATTKSVTVPAGGKSTVATFKGPQAITGLKVKLADIPKEIEAQRNLLAQLTVSITWDKESAPAVWAPLGDFFASAAGAQPFQTLPVGLLEDGTFYCYWYMPFGSKAQIEVGNDSANPVAMTWEVATAPLTQPIAKLGRFHAKWHRDAFLPERKDREIDWTLLTTQGKGRFVGTQLHIWNPRGGWWGEGDEKFFVDGEKFPSTLGTGSEDYFGYAWCDPARFVQAFHSQPVNEKNEGHVSVNRWHIADNIPFQASFEGDIEKYFNNQRYTFFAAVSFWYLNAGGKDPYPAVPVADRAGWWVFPEIYREPGVIEGEALRGKEPVKHQVRQQGMVTWGWNIWSGNSQLLWSPTETGEVVNLELPHSEPGKYRVVVRLTKSGDYGTCQLSVNQQKMGAPIDLFSQEVRGAEPLDLGVIDLSESKPVLTVELTGKNENSRGTQFGLDYIKLIPVK